LNLNLYLTLLINGLAMGTLYALIAMGLILLIRAVGVLNFAQGDLLMFGAFITCAFIVDAKLPFAAMAPLSLISFILVGIIFTFTVYWPTRNASYTQATTIATVGASIVLREMATLIWGSLPRSVPPILKNEAGKAAVITLGKTKLQWQYILIIVVGAVLMFLVFKMFEHLYVGQAMQAAAQDQYAANLLGIPSIITIVATYCLVVVLASIGGYLVSPIFMVSNTLGSLQLRAFAGVVIGGFGNIKGAIIGSLFVGVVEAFSTLKFTEYKDAVVFLILIVFLLARPQGIFGEKIADKA